MKFDIKCRWQGRVLFTADIEATASVSCSTHLGLAVKAAIKSRADLYGADLSRANLYGANLYGADLSRANLYGANLSNSEGAALAVQRTRILPEGSLIGWKKCRDGVLVKLRIPEEARRSHAFGRKCRTEFADVLEVHGADEGLSGYDGGKTVYRVGERVFPDAWGTEWQKECSPGIHFFITREEAEAY